MPHSPKAVDQRVQARERKVKGCGCPGHCTNLVHLAERRPKDARRQPLPPAKQVFRRRGASKDLQKCVVHRMPPEILGIIFEHCFDENTPSRAVVPQSPLLLGRVCSYWRSVSRDTQRLWTSLSLRFLETDVDRSRDGLKVASAVDTWLERSCTAPLSLAYTDNRIFQRDTEQVVFWLLSRIRGHAPRWKAIHLKFSSDYFTELSALSCAFTSLTSFSAHVDHMGWRRGLVCINIDLSQASQLTSLAYTGPDRVSREDIRVNWERLTFVAFSYDLHESGGQTATLPRHFSTLALCQNLTELSIGLSTTLAQHLHPLDAMAQGQAVITIIELPKLHTLRVRRLSRSAHACALIDALRLPRLTTLDIDSAFLAGWDSTHTPLSHPDYSPPQIHTTTHWWHAHHFSALLDRSECHLHTLHIRDVDMSPSELVRLLTSPSTSPTLATFTYEPFPRACPISDVLAHLVAAEHTPAQDVLVDPTSSPSLASATDVGPDVDADPPVSRPSSPAFPRLTQLRLGCAHENHLDTLADVIASRTGTRAMQAGVRSLATFELVFYDFVYSQGREQPWRKVCFDAFKERVLKCAREGGVDVDIRVERPYEPVYLSVP